MGPTQDTVDGQGLVGLLRGFSTEVVALDKSSLQKAGALLKPCTEVFVAGLPKDPAARQIDAAIELKNAGLIPVPHIVARNIENRAALDALVGAMATRAGVDRALVLAGDRERPAGIYSDSLQLLDSGVFEQFGIRHVFLACYPEGHARIADTRLHDALAAKLALAAARGLRVTLVSQFSFDATPIIEWTRAIRRAGVTAPYRVGVAGVASRAALLKFALLCGIGPSLRVLQERGSMAKNMLAGVTPEDVLTAVAAARDAAPELLIEGAHLFSFGALASTVDWIRSLDGGNRLLR